MIETKVGATLISGFEPKEDELGMLYPIICDVCGHKEDVFVTRIERPTTVTVAKCPKCKGRMVWNPSGMNILVTSRGPGVSSTKYGMKRARELTCRNEKLGKTQWDNVEPLKAREGLIPRNPTEGGPLDPNGPFIKKKKEKTISTASSSVNIKGSTNKKKKS